MEDFLSKHSLQQVWPSDSAWIKKKGKEGKKKDLLYLLRGSLPREVHAINTDYMVRKREMRESVYKMNAEIVNFVKPRQVKTIMKH